MKNGQHTVLCVDDDINILNSLKRLLRKEDYILLTASCGAEALSIMEEARVDLVISDQRMPEISGIEFLSTVKDKYPDTIRIVLSGYTDIDTITESVNKGHIYKIILKPWNDQNLILEIRQALKQFDLIQTNKDLHKTIVEQNDELKVINENLEVIINERTKDLEIQNKALELSRAILEEIPLPIIGVSKEMMIVFQNKSARELSDINNIHIGGDTSDFFQKELEEKIEAVLNTSNWNSIDKCPLGDHNYDIEIRPLSGDFKGKGVVLTLEQNSEHQH